MKRIGKMSVTEEAPTTTEQVHEAASGNTTADKRAAPNKRRGRPAGKKADGGQSLNIDRTSVAVR